jgi:hypothetical protein
LPHTLRSRLLAGAAPVAVLALVECASIQAQAQDIPDWLKPANYDVFLEGGYALGTGTNKIEYLQTAAGGIPTKRFDTDPGNGLQGRIGGTAYMKNGWSAGITYTGLRATKDGNSGGPAQNYAYTVFGAGANGYGAYATRGQATVHTSLKADTFDFQAGYDVGLGAAVGVQKLRSNVVLGARYLSVVQSTDVQINGAQSAHAHRDSTFDGWGPTLGLNSSLPLTERLGVEGGVLGGFLFGHLSSDSTSQSGQNKPGRRFSDERHGKTMDARLALTYAMPMGAASTFQLSGGYELTYMADVRDSQNGTGAFFNQSVSGSTSADLLFHGPFVRAKLSF